MAKQMSKTSSVCQQYNAKYRKILCFKERKSHFCQIILKKLTIHMKKRIRYNQKVE